MAEVIEYTGQQLKDSGQKVCVSKGNGSKFHKFTPDRQATSRYYSYARVQTACGLDTYSIYKANPIPSDKLKEKFQPCRNCFTLDDMMALRRSIKFTEQPPKQRKFVLATEQDHGPNIMIIHATSETQAVEQAAEKGMVGEIMVAPFIPNMRSKREALVVEQL